jgi:transcriptional regulator GlxA family with amidase domain
VKTELPQEPVRQDVLAVKFNLALGTTANEAVVTLANVRDETLAVRAGMAPRTFARAYAAKVGRTPAKTVELMRIEAACRALEETDLPLKSIAQSTGHGDEQNLRRAFQRQLVTNPGTHRLRFSSLLP